MSPRFALAILAVACACSSATTPPPAPGVRTLVLLHTTDEHSHLLGFGPEIDDYPMPTTPGTGAIRGGVARRMTILATERARARDAGEATLTLSSGDNTEGTLAAMAMTTAAPDWAAMRALGYDATTIGNHELDFGPGALAASIGVAQAGGGMVPVVSSNAHFSPDAGDDPLEALFDESGTDAAKPVHRSLVLTASNGVRVGIVGLLGASAARYAVAKGPLAFSRPPSGDESDDAGVMAAIYADLQPIVDHLRTDEHVDLVVALSHAGLDATGGAVAGEDALIAQNVAGIDVILSGHTHQVIPLAKLAGPSGRTVYAQEAGQFGEYVGRVVVKVDGAEVSVDPTASAILPVDDTTVGDPAMAPAIDRAIAAVEGDRGAGGASFLERALTAIEGAPVVDDPAKVGDLYFREVGRTTFDLAGLALRRETPLIDLSADAMLAAADAYAGAPTDVAVQAQGVLFADLEKGRTGAITYADLFRAVPLGMSPADGSPGFPLVRFNVWLAELKAALEVSAGYAYTSADAADYYLVTSGLRYTYDTSRAPFDPSGVQTDPNNGRVTKIELASDHASPDVYDKVLFDLSAGGWKSAITRPVSVVTNAYIAQFAYVAGVTLRRPDGGTFASPADAILRRGDASEVKDRDALAAFVRATCAANGGSLPARYDASRTAFPNRAVCAGPLCAK